MCISKRDPTDTKNTTWHKIKSSIKRKEKRKHKHIIHKYTQKSKKGKTYKNYNKYKNKKIQTNKKIHKHKNKKSQKYINTKTKTYQYKTNVE